MMPLMTRRSSPRTRLVRRQARLNHRQGTVRKPRSRGHYPPPLVHGQKGFRRVSENQQLDWGASPGVGATPPPVPESACRRHPPPRPSAGPPHAPLLLWLENTAGGGSAGDGGQRPPLRRSGRARTSEAGAGGRCQEARGQPTHAGRVADVRQRGASPSRSPEFFWHDEGGSPVRCPCPGGARAGSAGASGGRIWWKDERGR